jgi:hypothetical protein
MLKPVLKLEIACFQCLKLKCDEPLSLFAFGCNLRRYDTVCTPKNPACGACPLACRARQKCSMHQAEVMVGQCGEGHFEQFLPDPTSRGVRGARAGGQRGGGGGGGGGRAPTLGQRCR